MDPEQVVRDYRLWRRAWEAARRDKRKAAPDVWRLIALADQMAALLPLAIMETEEADAAAEQTKEDAMRALSAMTAAMRHDAETR